MANENRHSFVNENLSSVKLACVDGSSKKICQRFVESSFLEPSLARFLELLCRRTE